jgi:hypothetical protein
MKKFWILFGLFILPLVFYIFLSKGIYRYSNLPVLTEEVAPLKAISPHRESTFKDHLNVVCFLGKDLNTARASLFNLNQTIYKRYYQKPYFQMVALLPVSVESEFQATLKELMAFTDTVNWRFVFADEAEIAALFGSFKTPYQLNDKGYSEYAFIIDRELRLRGRKDDEDSADGRLYGYNMRSVALLRDKMKDDIDIIYYQLKQSAEKEKRRKRKI